MPSVNKVPVFTIGQAGVKKSQTVPMPVGLADTIIADGHWKKLETASQKNEAALMTALTRKPEKTVVR